MGAATYMIGIVVALAALAVVVSRQAQSDVVIGAAGGALGNIIGAAVSPIVGNWTNSFGSASH